MYLKSIYNSLTGQIFVKSAFEFDYALKGQLQ